MSHLGPGDAHSELEPSSWEAAVSVADFEQLAAATLPRAVFDYVSTGAGDERTLRRNVRAFDAWELLPRVLVDVSSIQTETEVLGVRASIPVLIAPLAVQRAVHEEGELATARAASSSGTIMCVSTISSFSLDEIVAAAPAGRLWFQLYALRDRGLTGAIVDAAVQAGVEAIVVTVDTPVLGRRDRALRNATEAAPPVPVPIVSALCGRTVTAEELVRQMDTAQTWVQIERLASDLPLPLVVKGLLTPSDAVRALRAGAAAVVISNHGGRQLDGVPATIDVLPDIVAATNGEAVVILDGGLRRGTDVLVALALGARAVLIGRPVLWSLAVGGERGVIRMLDLLREELVVALTLAGAPSIGSLHDDFVRRRPDG